MSSFSSSCLSSCRDRRCVLPGPGYKGAPPVPPGPLVLVQVAGQSPVGDTDRKVGVPSIVFTMGLRRPPRSNSCAEILRTGVVAPDPVLDGGAVLAGSAEPEVSAGLTWWLGDERSAARGTMQLLLLADVGVAWETSHVSTTCRVAFLPARRDNLMTNGSDGDGCAHYDKKTSNANRGNSLRPGITNPLKLRRQPGWRSRYSGWTVRYSKSGGRKTFYFFQNHPACCSKGTGAISWGQGGRGVKFTPHVHLVPRLRMSGAKPLPSLYAFTTQTGPSLLTLLTFKQKEP